MLNEMKSRSLAGNFKQYLKKRKSSPLTIQSHLRNIKRFENWLENEGLSIKIIDRKDILTYLQNCKEKGNSNLTLSHKTNTLRKYFTYLEVNPNPCQNLQIKGITKRLPDSLLNEKELTKLHESYPDKTIQNKRDKLILSLLIYQGITTAELINLELNDLNLEIGILEIKSSRQGEYRKLKLTDLQINDLKRYLKNTRPKLERASNVITNQLLINSGKSEQKTKLKNTIAELMKRLKKRHNYFKNARQLRGSRIALWLKTYNLREAQYMAGHRYVSSTERYSLNKTEDLQKALDKYHPRK